MTVLKLRIAISTILVGFLTLPSLTLAQDAYDYSTIQVPGSDGAQVFGINERGQIVGNALPGGIPFIYDVRNDDFDIVDDVAGFDNTAILGINNSSSMAGAIEDGTTMIRSGLLLDKQGNAHIFDHPAAVTNTTARAIGNREIITGIRDSSVPNEFLAAFLYDPSTGEFTDLVPSLFTLAQGINASGDIVGNAIFFAENDPCDPGAPSTGNGLVRYAWVRSADGAVQFFTVNGGPTTARGITDSGTVAGNVLDPDTGKTRGFVINIDSTPCQHLTIQEDNLLEFPGAFSTFLQDITNSGTVVGQYDVAGETFPQGFLASPQR